MVPDSLLLAGPDCSSWGIPARSVSCRSFINSFGNMSNSWVQQNNTLVSRKLNCIYGTGSAQQVGGKSQPQTSF